MHKSVVRAILIVATGGVYPFEEATKVRYADGEFTVIDGLYTEAKELIGGWALMEVRDKAEAIEWTKRFLALVRGVVSPHSGRLWAVIVSPWRGCRSAASVPARALAPQRSARAADRPGKPEQRGYRWSDHAGAGADARAAGR